MSTILLHEPIARILQKPSGTEMLKEDFNCEMNNYLHNHNLVTSTADCDLIVTLNDDLRKLFRGHSEPQVTFRTLVACVRLYYIFL